MEWAGRVATLTLQRPPVNALDLPLLERLARTVRALGEEGEATVLVLRSGLPGIFYGGFDVKALPDAAVVVNTPADVLSRSRAAQWAVLESPLVVISAIGGSAIGLGFLIPALEDVIVASRSARFGLPEIELNLIGGAGHCRRVMPEPVVRYLTLTGRRVGPEYLERLGAVALVGAGRGLGRGGGGVGGGDRVARSGGGAEYKGGVGAVAGTGRETNVRAGARSARGGGGAAGAGGGGGMMGAPGEPDLARGLRRRRRGILRPGGLGPHGRGGGGSRSRPREVDPAPR